MPGRPLVNFYPAIVATATRGPYGYTRGLIYETGDGQQRLAVIASDGHLIHDLPASGAVEMGGPNSGNWSVTVTIDEQVETWNVQIQGGCTSCGGDASQATADQLVVMA